MIYKAIKILYDYQNLKDFDTTLNQSATKIKHLEYFTISKADLFKEAEKTLVA